MKSILENGKQLTHTQQQTKVEKNPLNLAASWYVVMLSKELGKKPKAIQLFGRDLVAWRDGNSNPVIMERYCSHMGASLAIGEIKDNCIQCPFHHWRYDNLGDCVSIPDIENIPPTAHQETYVTTERYGYIWVWYGTSSPLFPLLEFSPAEEEKHKYMRFSFRLNTKTTVLALMESGYDYSHLVTLHKLPATSVQVTLFDKLFPESQNELRTKNEAWYGNLYEARLKSFFGPISALAKILGLNTENLSNRTETWPSGFNVTGFVDGEERYRMLVGLTPVAQSQTILWFWISVKKTGSFWLDILSYLVFGGQTKATVEEDKLVFDTGNPELDKVYVKHDQGVLKFRKFYQKWVDKVEV
jgi:aminopyrrolnitrin oxygenase